MRTLTIESGKGEKTRSFQAVMLAHVRAELLMPTTDDGMQRPVWAVFAGSENQMQAFVSNLKAGKKALDEGKSSSFKGVEFLKSADFAFAAQREREGVLVTAYLPDLVRLDPGMVDPAGVRFLMVVPEDWHAAQTVDGAASMVDFCRRLGFGMACEEDVPEALLFAACLDRRTRAPILADGAFALQLYYAFLRDGLASWPDEREDWNRRSEAAPFGVSARLRITAEGLADAKVRRVTGVVASHDEVEALLAQEVDAYFRGLDGKRRRAVKPKATSEVAAE
jgi:hypothetical protein